MIPLIIIVAYLLIVVAASHWWHDQNRECSEQPCRNLTRYTLDPQHPPTLSPQERERMDKIDVDYGDISELPGEFFDSADDVPPYK
jgi:hypothetical protein